MPRKVWTTTEHGISFWPQFVNQIRDGDKVQSRRPIKLDQLRKVKPKNYHLYCPYGVPGHWLFVMEQLRKIRQPGGVYLYRYVADELLRPWAFKKRKRIKPSMRLTRWHPITPPIRPRFMPSSIMPKKHARMWLLLEDVGIQPIAAITEQQAWAEGFKSVVEFQETWIKMYGEDSWENNDLVWVLTFHYEPIMEKT